MSAHDLARALATIRARNLEADDDEEVEPVDLGEIHEEAEEEADAREQEDAARRSRGASQSRAQLVDYAAQRGVRLSREEQSAPMDNIRKIVLERLAGLAVR